MIKAEADLDIKEGGSVEEQDIKADAASHDNTWRDWRQKYTQKRYTVPAAVAATGAAAYLGYKRCASEGTSVID